MLHEQKIQSVVNQIKERATQKQPIKISKTAVSHFVPNPYDKRNKLPKINIRSFNEILKIDPENKICIAESGVTFSELVKNTLKYGLIPYTVPELKTITIGGAVSGCSIESMSFKYGGFHDSCIEYEVISGTGEIVVCSPQKNSELFHMIHGSYGTLGILSKLTFKLLPARPYVKMNYVSFDNFDGFWKYLQDRCDKKDYDFIDGIIHSPKKFVVCLGTMVDSVPFLSSYEWLNIFYKSTANLKEDYLKIYDYFFRYDTECHWLTKTIPLLESKPARFAVGKFVLGSSNLIKWSKRLKPLMKIKKRPEVVVDVFIPDNNFEKFYKWYEKEFDFYPLWIVPYKSPQIYPWINTEHARKMNSTFFIDCAVYGKINNDPIIDYSETLEKKTVELNGIKTLISRNHFDEKTFWKVYNRAQYESVKSRIDPLGLFNDLYSKFKPSQYR